MNGFIEIKNEKGYPALIPVSSINCVEVWSNEKIPGTYVRITLQNGNEVKTDHKFDDIKKLLEESFK